MGRDDDWTQGGEWIRGDERESGGEWVSGGAGRRIEYGETTVAPGVAWTTVWGAEAEEDAEDEADEDDWPDDDWPDDDSLEDGWPDGEWPDGEWLDGESFAAPGGPMGTPGRPAGPGSGFGYRTGGWGHGGIPGFSARMAVAVAVVAAVAGVAAGFILTRGAPVASAAGGAMPSVPAPVSAPPSTGSGAGPRALPGPPGNAGGNGDEQLRMLLTGRVLAVSRTSVTIGGAGSSVTASVTSTTRLTGRVHALSGVKVGDEVAAQITGTPSHLVVTTLQDPAQ
jgi:hypothetical protein